MTEKGKQERVTLANLGRGAAAERFDDELKRVIENIMDPNTEATAKRMVVLKIKIKPDKDRAYAEVKIDCSAQLAPFSEFKTGMFIGRGRDGAKAFEQNPNQASLFEDDEETRKLRIVGGEKEVKR